MATAKKKQRNKPEASMEPGEFKKIRDALGMTQSELSERTGIHRVTIAQYETGFYPIFKPVAELMRCLNRERKAKG
jgi:transcriptional regulator with XRE-family HTH domain